jgi:hypothetical protein
MPNISVPQTSFVGGEFAPTLYARTDIQKYPTALRKMLNFYPHAHGGASNRGGTQFVGEAKYKDRYCRVVPFQFSVVQSYMLEFGHNYIRFYKDGGRIVENDVSISAITKAAQGVVTANAHGFVNGNWLILYVEGMTELYGKIVVVSDKDANTFKMKDVDGNYIDTTNFTTFTSGVANRILEVTTTYAEGDLWLLKFNQSADVLYITHPSYEPKKLTRSSHIAWTFSAISIGPKISAPRSLTKTGSAGTSSVYVVTAVSTDGEESIASNTVAAKAPDQLSWTAPLTGTVNYYNIYKDDYASGVYGWIGYSNSTNFTEPAGTIIADTSKTPPKTGNPFSGAGNYPGCSTFFEQRLVFARSDNKPQTVFGSVIGNFENFNISSPLKDDDAFTFTMNATQVNEIRWLVPLEVIIIGTSGGEFKMTNGSNSDAITPTNVNLKRQSNWGVDNLQPVVIGNTIIFVDGSKAKVRDLTYNLNVEGYTGNELSIFAEHLLKGYELLDWCYQRSPDGIIWAVRNDGVLIGMTYLKEHEIFGWHQHKTKGLFESVANISVSSGVDETWLVVKRTIDGVDRRFVERFMPRLPVNWDFEYLPENAYFVDCGLSYDGWNVEPTYGLELTGGTTWKAGESLTLTASGVSNTPFTAAMVGRYFKLQSRTVNTDGSIARESCVVKITAYTDVDEVTVTPYLKTIPVSLRAEPTSYYALMVTGLSGLDHLEGEDVNILADGNVIIGKSVSGGIVTFDRPIAKAHIGFSYTCDLETLDFEYATETGTVQDKNRNVISAVCRFEKTRGLFIGPSEDKLVEMAFRSTEDLGDPISLFTGDKEEALETADDPRQGRVFMRIEDPIPVTVLSVIARMSHGEK